MASKISNISQALAAGNPRAAEAKPNASSNLPGFEGIAVAKRTGISLGLPTPPNSISPSLPPVPFRTTKRPNESAGSPLSQIDSDIDLQDALDHADSQDRPADGLADLGDDPAASEGMGTITAMLLAKHYLAEILLEKGPLAIRHMMNYLNQAVPGFSEIPPTKARRIVVAALENRSGGGPKGDVEFEKVGWGRWDAHVKGQMPKNHRMMYPIREGGAADFAKSAPAGALRIPNSGLRRPSNSRRPSHGRSWTDHSTMASRLEVGERSHKDVAEDEADKMSIDGDEEEPTRSPPPRGRFGGRSSVPANYSDTDEEDWASMGAEALRKSSVSSSAGGAGRSTIHSHMRMALNRRPSAFASHPMSAPGGSAILQQHRQQQMRAQSREVEVKGVDFTGMDVDQQERDAIQALLRMGSI